MKRNRIQWIPGVAAAFAAMLAATPTAAQDVDSRWLPWMGCWEVLGAGAQVDVVCVRPHEDEAAVTLDYVREDIEDLVVRADGVFRQSEQAGCEGSESATFSPDGTRIYVKAQYICDGGKLQTGTGLFTMLSEDEWIEIRSLTVDEETVAWVQRYVQATPAAVEAAGEMNLATPDVILSRRMASRAPTLNTIAEVAFAVDAKVASAWLVESGYSFSLNGDQLLALADVGVDPEVIDVAVAVSNPEHFNIGAGGALRMQSPEGRAQRPGPSLGYMPYFGRRFYNYGGLYSPWGFMYSPYGYGYDPYYAYNYGYGGYYGGYRPTYLVVTPRTSDQGTGRAVAGQGYTRGRSSPPSSAQGGWQPPRSSGSSGGSSGGSTSTGSSSGGSSSQPPTRTAKPRGGGGL